MKCTIAVLLLPATLSIFSNVASGQSALEKLEQKVREQLGEKTPDVATEELPSPKLPNQKRLPDQGQSQLDNTAASSTVPSPTGVQNPSTVASSEKADRTGKVYLGLEAEKPVGGGIGVRVYAITPQSPAWKAGFEVGDRILAVGDFAIADLDHMIEQLAKTSPGEAVQFLVQRGGRNTNLTAVLMDADLAARLADSVEPRISNSPNSIEPGWLGVVATDLTDAFRQQFAIPVFRGAAVTNVVFGSPAHKESIRAGDVITEAKGIPITGERDLLAWMSGRRAGERIELGVYRGSAFRNVVLTLEVNPERRKALNSAQSPIPNPSDTFLQSPTIESQPPPAAGPFPLLESSSPKLEAPEKPGNANQAASLIQENERLRQENTQLQAELEAARKRLENTQKRLNDILEALKGEKTEQ